MKRDRDGVPSRSAARSVSGSAGKITLCVCVCVLCFFVFVFVYVWVSVLVFDWFRFGSIYCISVRFGSVRFGSVRFGSVRFGSVRIRVLPRGPTKNASASKTRGLGDGEVGGGGQ